MNKLLFLFCVVLVGVTARAATITVNPWQPTFKGVDYATGQQDTSVNGEYLQKVSCFRIDLTDPDVRLFSTPACSDCAANEVLAENTSHFLEQFGVQLAVNCNFYSSSFGPGDVPLGTPENILGLAICTGRVVSVQGAAENNVTIMFATNNLPFFVPANTPTTPTDGIFSAITGNHVLLSGGVNTQSPNPIDRDPRTAVGLSQDRHYLYLLTVDGRQPQDGFGAPSWSNGADFYDTGEWLRRFGAYDGINVDGGGSTTMVMADCQGKSLPLNRSSFVFQYGRERITGHNLGVYALPLPTQIKDISVRPGTTTAILTWHTDFPATTQVEYGLTSSYGSTTALDPQLLREHIVTLNGLSPDATYYFRARSSDGVTVHTLGCSFATTSSVARTLLVNLTNPWRFTTNNLDSTPTWKSRSYDDSSWSGPSNACLHIENSILPPGISFPPRNTVLPPGYVSSIFRTYYFRTHFNFTAGTNGLSLSFSNYVDDGAVFYLNGAEIYRLRMAASPIVIQNSTFASGVPCQGQFSSGDAVLTCVDQFTISGSLAATNVLQGDNVLAVEVHNYQTGADILFGSALIAAVPGNTFPRLLISTENGVSTIYWNGQGYTLQRSTDLSSPANWSDVPGPITSSPFTGANSPSTFYRLRN